MDEQTYKDVIEVAVAESTTFIRFTASGQRRGDRPTWQRVTARPVDIRGTYHVQFLFHDGQREITRNHRDGSAWRAELHAVLGDGYANFHIQSESGDTHIRLTKRGRALISRGRPSTIADHRRLEHNREKRRALLVDVARPFLEAIGILGADGRVKPTMQAKYRQINTFVELFAHAVPDRAGPLSIVDCGCGSAYLTFAAYAYLTQVRDQQARVTGVDVNASLVAKGRALASQLGWEDVQFVQSTIAGFAPDDPPGVVLSLHACDTATDEAVAQGVHWGAKAILAAPCCQHELRNQIGAAGQEALLAHGILKQRTADLVTDALRAAALNAAGYRAEVMEFVSPDATAKNLLIRAVRTGQRRSSDLNNYLSLRDLWQVKPSIERLLGSALMDPSAST